MGSQPAHFPFVKTVVKGHVVTQVVPYKLPVKQLVQELAETKQVEHGAVQFVHE